MSSFCSFCSPCDPNSTKAGPSCAWGDSGSFHWDRLGCSSCKVGPAGKCWHSGNGPATDSSLIWSLKTQTSRLTGSYHCLIGKWVTCDLYPWQYPSSLLYPRYTNSVTSYFHRAHRWNDLGWKKIGGQRKALENITCLSGCVKTSQMGRTKSVLGWELLSSDEAPRRWLSWVHSVSQSLICIGIWFFRREAFLVLCTKYFAWSSPHASQENFTH